MRIQKKKKKKKKKQKKKRDPATSAEVTWGVKNKQLWSRRINVVWVDRWASRVHV